MSCLPVLVCPIPGEAELWNDLHSTPCVLVAQHGRGSRWYQNGGRTMPLSTSPRMIEIYEAGQSFDYCRWEGEAGRCVVIEFSNADVESMTHGELRSLPLETRHALFDERISRIALEIAEEALQSLPSGQMYVQGLCVSLVGLLASGYIGGQRPLAATTSGRLGSTQQRRLVDLIEHQLASDVSLSRLAEEVGLSVHYFSRIFKATFGTTPHRYVQERRLDAAAEALVRQGSRSIAEIALECGFANQAHMTDLVRRRFGVTPRVLRTRG